MDIDRRSLMKGMLASGALVALGTPPWSFAESPVRKAGQYGLLLGGSPADENFARGARAASAAMTYGELPSVVFKDGLLAGEDEAVNLLERSKGTRWITVMDDAAAMIFLELTRAAGARMLSMGMHACTADGAYRLRHDVTTASAVCSTGELLASQLIQKPHDCSIRETFLSPSPVQSASSGWSARGVSSYRLREPDVFHLHCAGLSLTEGCERMSLPAAGDWTAIPPAVSNRDVVSWPADNWVQSVGYAVAAAALGLAPVAESCSGRAFIHKGERSEPQPTDRFTSFIIDI